MKYRKKVEWTKLDNASKIFPSICNEKDTKVFRLVCELHEAVNKDILEQALEKTLENFPLYNAVLRRGVFWYYLEASDMIPVVLPESNPVCAPIYFRDIRNLLFRVFYYQNRINLEVFHVLSDGTGALWFMQTLVYHYLILNHKNSFPHNIPSLDYKASISEKRDDSFGRYFTGGNHAKSKDKMKDDNKKAYHILGSRMDENRMKLIEGTMSVKKVLALAHEYNTTLTVFITSLFIYCIHKQMPTRKKNLPVVLSVPINLRKYFKSETARNFFSTMNVSFQFNKGDTEFVDVILGVTESFQKELTEDKLNERLEHFMALEKNPFTRIIPLTLKDYSLRIANVIKDRGITTAISNIGRIAMPSEFDSYIKQFSLCTSARRPQICMCSYRDKLVISFTSPYHETELQRIFFAFLTSKGIDVEIATNR